MATLRIPPLLRDATAGAAVVEVPGGTVRSALESACLAHPALRQRLFTDEGGIRHHLAVVVDTAQVDSLRARVDEDAEIVIVPAIGGG